MERRGRRRTAPAGGESLPLAPGILEFPRRPLLGSWVNTRKKRKGRAQ
jgi:hypothetical protein